MSLLVNGRVINVSVDWIRVICIIYFLFLIAKRNYYLYRFKTRGRIIRFEFRFFKFFVRRVQ
jgi:hypothetical protein